MGASSLRVCCSACCSSRRAGAGCTWRRSGAGEVHEHAGRVGDESRGIELRLSELTGADSPAEGDASSGGGDRARRGGDRGPLARDRAAQHRLAGPVHGRLHVAGERDLLLARGDRRPRARAHAARVPVGGAAVRADGDDLRGGRLAASGSWRLDRVRPLRVQRARELHRRLGDPARLHHPDRRHGLLGDPVPAGVLAPAGAQRRSRCCSRWRSSRSSCWATSAASAVRRSRRVGAAGGRRSAGAAADRGDRAGAVLQPADAARPDPSGQRADVVGSHVRPDGRRDLLHQPRVGRRAGGRGADRPARPEAHGR